MVKAFKLVYVYSINFIQTVELASKGIEMAHVRTYNPRVRVGNWKEDVTLEEVCLLLTHPILV